MGQLFGKRSVSIDEYAQSKDSKLGKVIDVVTSFKFRLPYIWEAFTGMNMAYYYAQQMPNNLLTSELRKCVKSGDTATIKAQIFKGLWDIDDPLDIYSKHTLLHDSVVMDRDDLFNFLIQQGANPMCCTRPFEHG
jgi:hypothetical protein